MLEELVKTVRLHLSERLTSPLFGAFVVSWAVWNYRLLLIILSSEPVAKKLMMIDTAIFPSTQHITLHGIVYPLITSLAYLFLYPFPAKFVYAFTRRQQRAILNIRRRIEEETPLTVEDSRKIRSELARAEQEYFSELDRKDREIEKLRTQLSVGNPDRVVSVSQPEEQESPNRVETAALGSELVTILAIIEKLDGEAPEKMVISASGMSKTEAEYYLGELTRQKLVERNYKSTRSAYVYTFTHKGRAALLEAKKQ